MTEPAQHRAQPPRAPTPTPEVQRARATERLYKADREAELRRSLLRGLLWLLAIVLVFSIVRAGVSNVFFPGWWRP